MGVSGSRGTVACGRKRGTARAAEPSLSAHVRGQLVPRVGVAEPLEVVAIPANFNDDGIQDLAIGYTEYDSYKGEDIIDYGPVGSIMASDAVITGVSSDYLGSSIAAGDLDNDGIDDLAIGAYNNSEGGTGAGAVYVFLGGGI